MERIVLTHLQTFADDPVSDFPKELQHTILSLLKEIVHARGSHHCIAVVSLDLEKVFELVDHHIVLTLVLELGVTGNVLAFVRD